MNSTLCSVQLQVSEKILMTVLTELRSMYEVPKIETRALVVSNHVQVSEKSPTTLYVNGIEIVSVEVTLFGVKHILAVECELNGVSTVATYSITDEMSSSLSLGGATTIIFERLTQPVQL